VSWPPPPADAAPAEAGADAGAGGSAAAPGTVAAAAPPPVDEDAIDATNPGQLAPAAPDFPPPDSPAPPSPPAPPGSPDVASQPVPSGPFEAVDWGDPVETRQPLPVATRESEPVDARQSADQVLGIRCSRDHFNNPNAGYCQVCGISMIHLTHRLEPGPRPTLGFVVFADGATYAVDRPYLIGRKPQPGPNSGLTALATQDQTQSVSREHAELRLDGWDVHYVDLGSTNGSFVWSPTSQAWMPLRSNEPLTLTSGTTVSVGRMTFVFQGASKAVEGR
ncbi:MAG: FHA domain-containing protein, partial [Actinomycetota bacterium]